MAKIIARRATITATTLVLGMLGSVATADAQQASGTIQLRGTVNTVCTVAVTDLNYALNITGGETNRTIGNVVENCNSGSGYTVSIASNNAGALRATDAAGNPTVGYTVNFDGQSGTLQSAMAVSRSTAQFGKQSALAVSVPANPQAVAGSYADTITITIAAR